MWRGGAGQRRPMSSIIVYLLQEQTMMLSDAENNMMEKMKNDQHERLLRPDSNTNISEALQDWTVPEMGDRYSSEMIRS